MPLGQAHADHYYCNTRVFIPVSDFSFPGIGNGKMSFPGIPGIPGMQGVIQ